MSTISIKVTEVEMETINDYANHFGISVSDFVKKAVLDRIENLSELRIIETYERSKVQEENGIISLKDVKKQLGL